MKETEQKKGHKKGNWGVRGVYAALAVCLVAVGAAAWTTFDSISTTLRSNTQSQKQTEPTTQTVSGVIQSTTSEAVSAEETDLDAETASTAAEVTALQLPLSNGISRSFSGEELIYSETLKDWRTHNGTDFSGEEGEAVLSAADGTVKEVREDSLMGNVVVVTSGTLELSYCGLNETDVQTGDKVTAGQTLGSLGIIPAEQAEGVHLHLEIQQDGAYVDCESLLSGNG
ncbi:MAG: M23 family metallopeptidase [Oscillospiraceae bacterium]|nr:M23 family metallopeptidase [Oscillospiraceae bacterium]